MKVLSIIGALTACAELPAVEFGHCETFVDFDQCAMAQIGTADIRNPGAPQVLYTGGQAAEQFDKDFPDADVNDDFFRSSFLELGARSSGTALVGQTWLEAYGIVASSNVLKGLIESVTVRTLGPRIVNSNGVCDAVGPFVTTDNLTLNRLLRSTESRQVIREVLDGDPTACDLQIVAATASGNLRVTIRMYETPPNNDGFDVAGWMRVDDSLFEESSTSVACPPPDANGAPAVCRSDSQRIVFDSVGQICDYTLAIQNQSVADFLGSCP